MSVPASIFRTRWTHVFEEDGPDGGDVEEDHRRQEDVEQDEQGFSGRVGGALRPAPLRGDPDAYRQDDRAGGEEDAYGERL